MASARGEIRSCVGAWQEVAVAHLIQVGAGSGGMPVLDMLCRDPALTHITLIEPDIYKPHNAPRHFFPASAAGMRKLDLARDWLLQRRGELTVELVGSDLLDPAIQERLD